jgi:hypothetical protein
MTTQSAAVMQRMKGTEIVERSSEEIFNQFSQMHELIARRAFEIFESICRRSIGRRTVRGKLGGGPEFSCSRRR